MIIVIFGQPCAGKTTLANALVRSISDNRSVEIIDGDDLRKIFINKDYSKEGRIKNNNRASDIAVYLNSKKTNYVIISLMYPYAETRAYLNSLCDNTKWIYLTYTGERGREDYHLPDFEEPIGENYLRLNTSALSVDQCISLIKTYIK